MIHKVERVCKSTARRGTRHAKPSYVPLTAKVIVFVDGLLTMNACR
jgi:hypothetical protein